MVNFNFTNIEEIKKQWNEAKPFPHVVIDNFLPKNLAEQIVEDFPSKEASFWHEYSNPLEVKKTCNDWNKFSETMYTVFTALLAPVVVEKLSYISDKNLIPDIGLHGGGMHCHASGGKLNTHLDYSIHPKLNLQRKINIIIYLNKDWDPSWGGSLGLWSHNPETRQPNELINKIECVFNRAVIFDTTMNSWHGLPDAISCPDNRSRNSLAVYYLCEPEMNADERQKVLFAPTEEQKGDSFIEDLIVKRASSKNASSVYKI